MELGKGWLCRLNELPWNWADMSPPAIRPGAASRTVSGSRIFARFLIRSGITRLPPQASRRCSRWTKCQLRSRSGLSQARARVTDTTVSQFPWTSSACGALLYGWVRSRQSWWHPCCWWGCSEAWDRGGRLSANACNKRPLGSVAWCSK